MSETAAHLVDHVLPYRNIRQWVLTFPVPIRLCLAVQPKVMARALEIAHLVIGNHYRKKTGLTAKNSKTGAALKLTPMELMERLVALVPRPRVHLTRYHGVLGPHYKHRKQIIPKPPELKIVTQGQETLDLKDLKQLEVQKKKNIPWARLHHHFEDEHFQQHFEMNFDNFN